MQAVKVFVHIKIMRVHLLNCCKLLQYSQGSGTKKHQVMTGEACVGFACIRSRFECCLVREPVSLALLIEV